MADDNLVYSAMSDFRRTKNDLGDPFKTERMSASLPSYGRAPPMPRQLREFLAGAPQAPNQQRVFGQPRRADRDTTFEMNEGIEREQVRRAAFGRRAEMISFEGGEAAMSTAAQGEDRRRRVPSREQMEARWRGGYGPPSSFAAAARAGAAPSGRPLASEPPSAFAGRPPSQQVRGRRAAGGAPPLAAATAELARLGGDMTLELGPTVNTMTVHAAAKPTPKSPGHGRRAPLNGARARGAGGSRGAAPSGGAAAGRPDSGFCSWEAPSVVGVASDAAAGPPQSPSPPRVVAAAAPPAGASPVRMHRAKVWTPAVEDAWRAQLAGYRDVHEAEAVMGSAVDRWVNSGFVKKLPTKASVESGAPSLLYFRKTRECADNHLDQVKVYEYE